MRQAGVGSSKPKTLPITASGAGKAVKLSVPAGAEAGVTQIRFQNQAKSPRDAQLIRIEGNHTVEDVAKVFAKENGPIPSWLADGGGSARSSPGRRGP